VSVAFLSSSSSPPTAPPRTLASYASLNSLPSIGLPISPPHHPYPLCSSCDSSNPPPSPGPLIVSPLTPPPFPPRCPLSPHPSPPLLLVLRRVPISNSPWSWWGGGHTDLLQDNNFLHHPLPHHPLPPAQVINDILRHYRWFNGSWLPTMKVLLFRKGVQLLQGLHPVWYGLGLCPVRTLIPLPFLPPQLCTAPTCGDIFESSPKRKAQSSNVSFHWNVANEPFKLWALNFQIAFEKMSLQVGYAVLAQERQRSQSEFRDFLFYKLGIGTFWYYKPFLF